MGRPGGPIGENLAVMAMLPMQTSPDVGVAKLGSMTPGIRRSKKEDRIPQWGYDETKEFIALRAELEKDFMQTKRNKTLWEFIAGKMKEKGYRRNADQCKCKWKNLVNQYKGKETSEVDNGKLPFFEELDAIFKDRAKNMDRMMLLEAEAGSRPHKKGKLGKPPSSDEDSDDGNDEDNDSEDERINIGVRKSRKSEKGQRVTAEKFQANSMQEVLEEFFQQQQRAEEHWHDAVERREHEWHMREQEWRDAMEKLEQERITREQGWREREEQRRAREEARAQKRDELFAALLSKLAQEGGY
ncbi:unnamed protein product [Sphagnum troendelagicum]|uniref:Myb-like domain-containing protein n=1 Tax=Sphagnum troendelagicum TaxID=128251 RepID=A0ABP0UF18_9BRYO